MGNSRKNVHLTKKQLKELKDIILAERERVQNKLNFQNPTKSFNDTNSGKDEVDSANDDIMRRSELRFATRETLYLKKIIKTVDLMETVDYGGCEECGLSISFTRLKARPTSTMCITCKEESERDEQKSYHGRISKSLSKTAGTLS